MRRAASTTLARPRRLRSPLPPPPPVPQRSRDDPGLYRVATVPNALSAFRIAAAPAVGVLVWHGHHDAAALAGCALSLTDWLDGYLAQKLDQETILGKFLDPLGDKALVCCVGVPLALRGELPLALVGLVVARDVGLVFGTRQALRKARSSKTYDPRFFLFGGMDPRAIVLDAAPDLAVPATISYVADVAQFTPKTVETEIERQKLMFRIRAQIDKDLLLDHIEYVKTGLPGVTYVKVDPNAEFPAEIESKLAQQ